MNQRLKSSIATGVEGLTVDTVLIDNIVDTVVSQRLGTFVEGVDNQLFVDVEAGVDQPGQAVSLLEAREDENV